MKFNKININRPPLSADDMSAAMDFDGLTNNPPAVGQSTSTPASGAGKLIKLIGYGIGVAAVAVAGWFFMNRSENNQAENTEQNAPVHQVADDSASKDTEPLINPPLKDVVLPYETAMVSGDSNSEVKLGSSIIKVPENCFVTKDGTPVTGDVELKYREFNNNLDIFLSGIPMQYDSAGVNYTFESNGMFEVRGYQNGEPVAVAPEKELEIAMEIEEVKPGFSDYYLNEETGRWDFRNGQKYEMEKMDDEQALESSAFDDIDNELDYSNNIKARRTDGKEVYYEVVEINQTNQTAQLDTEIKQIEKKRKSLQKPVKPKKADEEIPQIALEVNFKDFPELKGFKNTLFQVAEKDLGTFDAKWGEETWNDISVSKSSLPGNYRMIFSRPGKRVRVTCSPVVSEADLPNAMAIYDDLFDNYESSIDSLDQVKEQKKIEKREALAKARAEAVEQQKLAQKQQEVRRQEALERQRQMTETQRNAILNQQKITRTSNKLAAIFRANQFGYYNCDSPMGRIRGAQNIIANYQTGGEGAVVGQVNLVENGRRAILRRYQDYSAQINPSKKNTFFTVTSENTLAVAVVEPNELKGKKSCVIKMKECEEEITSRQQVEEFLKDQGIEL